MNTAMSTIAALGALVAFGLLALAGTIMVTGADSTQRLALLFGILGTGVATLVALLKADQAATQTNGALDKRIEAAVLRVNATRRVTDTTTTPPDPNA